MRTKKTLLILPFIPESDSVENIFYSEIKGLLATGADVFIFLIALKNQTTSKENSFIKKISKINLTNKQKNILFVGKLNHAKGYDIFADAALKFKKKI
jgi:glycosyltransferase involved in cell wall biosynthesis